MQGNYGPNIKQTGPYMDGPSGLVLNIHPYLILRKAAFAAGMDLKKLCAIFCF